MGWKSVAWTACLLPVLTGCGSVRNLTSDTRLAYSQFCVEHDLRKCARVAWQTVRTQHPRRAFTDEFRDGFLDGYVDYLDRGGSPPPAVPPLKYVRDKKYFTPEGHCLFRDYSLGFKYGTDVAIASGRREFLTAGAMLSDGSCVSEFPLPPGPPVIPMKPGTSDPKPPTGSDTLPAPRPLPGGKKPLEPIPVPPAFAPDPEPEVNQAIPPLPKPELPIIPPYNPNLSGEKFTPTPLTPEADRLPVPYPPLPITAPPIVPLPVPTNDSRPPLPPVLGPLPTPIPVFKVTLPAPPDAVPMLPAGVPTPPVLDEIPARPFQHTVPAPIPAGGLFPRK